MGSNGNQTNCVHDVNYTGNIGLYYKINNTHYLSIAANTQVNTYGKGKSTLNKVVNDQLSLNITQAPVIYLGLEHFFTDWFLEEKIYWSGWSIQKNLNFTNTTTGSYIIPTNLHDVWSFQATIRYAIKSYIGIVASALYETNPVPLETNAIGYPLAVSNVFTGGIDLAFTKELSCQLFFTYGSFIPNSPLENMMTRGIVNANTKATTFQIQYKT